MPPLSILALFCLLVLGACASAPGIDRPMVVDAAYADREDSQRAAGDRCGPEFIERVLPEFVLSTLEPLIDGPFGPVCKRHDACYRLGEQSQTWCDLRMRTEMIDICNAGRREGSVGGGLCRVRAGAYHGMVDSTFGAYAYGGEAGGDFTSLRIASSHTRQLDVCVTVRNTTHLMQSYAIEMRNGDGKRIRREPRQLARQLRAGETAEMCTGTTASKYWNRKRLTGPLEIRLMAASPGRLWPRGRMVELQSKTFGVPGAAD